MLYVINRYRVLSQTPEEAAALLGEIEAASRLKATALVNNSHLGVETQLQDLLDALGFAQRASQLTGLPLLYSTAPDFSLKEGEPLFAGLPQEPYVYFVHSYYLQAQEDVVTATAAYGATIHAAVRKGNLMACQFHPEKSGRVGLQILENFAAMLGKGA